MRKKRLITISIILSVFAILIILASTVFMLQKVSVNYLSSTEVLTETDASGIIKSGKFKYGGNVLFMNFDKQIARIEAAYPYAKVEKIERKFPNKAVIHISERTPAAFIQIDPYVYVVDSEMKVLNVLYSSDYNDANAALTAAALQAPKLIGVQVNQGTTVGTKVTNETATYVLQSAEHAMSRLNRTITQLATIQIFANENEEFKLNIVVDNNEMVLVVKGSDNLENKIKIGIQEYFEHIATHPGATGTLEQVSSNDLTFVHHN